MIGSVSRCSEAGAAGIYLLEPKPFYVGVAKSTTGPRRAIFTALGVRFSHFHGSGSKKKK